MKINLLFKKRIEKIKEQLKFLWFGYSEGVIGKSKSKLII